MSYRLIVPRNILVSAQTSVQWLRSTHSRASLRVFPERTETTETAETGAAAAKKVGRS